MDDETAELESAIRELAKEFADAAEQVAAIPAPRHVRRARKLVEAGWNRRCFTCENRTERNIIGERKIQMPNQISPRALIADAIAGFMPEGDDGQDGLVNLSRADDIIKSLSPHYEITVRSYRIDPPGYPD